MRGNRLSDSLAGTEWLRLTTVPDKIHYYQADLGFREGYSFLTEVWGEKRHAYLQRTAMLTIRPDGLAAGSGAKIVEELQRRGYVPVWWGYVPFDVHVTRRLWQYQLNVATLDRLQMLDVLWNKGPGMVIVLVRRGALDVPATSRLTTEKGSALMHEREEDSIRAAVQAHHRMLTFIHVPDEPADIVREISIVHSGSRAAEIATAIARGVESGETSGWPEFDEVAEPLVPAPDALRQVLARLDEHGEMSASGQTAVSGLAAPEPRPDAEREATWSSWARAMAELGMEPASWVSLAAASCVVPLSRQGLVSTIKETGKRRWLRGEGIMEA